MRKILIILITVVFSIVNLQAQEKLSLSEAIKIGLENNYDLKIVRNDEKVAELENSWGNTSALPTLDFSLPLSEEFTYDDTNYRTQTISPQLSLNWVVFNGFSARITKSRYQELENLSKGNTAIMIESTVEDIISAYNNCVLQNEIVKVYESLANLSKDRYDRELNSKELGVSTTYESLQAKTSWLEDKSNYLDQKVVYENSVRTLNYLLGVDNNSQWELTTGLNVDMQDYALSNLIDKLLSNNQTLRNQYINQELLAKATSLAKSSYYPTLSVNGSLGHLNYDVKYESGSANQDVSTSNSSLGVGMTLSYSIFNGNAKKRSLQIAKIEEESGIIGIAQMEHSLQNQLLQLYSTYEVQKELLLLAKEQESAAKLNLELSEEKLKNGSINSFNFRDVQNTYMNSAIRSFNAIYNLIESETDLLRITGGIIDEYK